MNDVTQSAPPEHRATQPRTAQGNRATIHIVDDNPRARSLVSRLVTEVGFDGVEYSNGQDFLDRAKLDAPSCVVLDIRMPGMSGLAVQRRLREWNNPPPVIVVSGQADVRTAVEAMQHGAYYLLEKPFRAEEFIDLVQRAVREAPDQGGAPEDRESVRRAFEDLSVREREVSVLAVTGLSTKGIAQKLGISVQAVNGHKRSAMTKLGVDNLPDLVRRLDSIDLRRRQ